MKMKKFLLNTMTNLSYLGIAIFAFFAIRNMPQKPPDPLFLYVRLSLEQGNISGQMQMVELQ
jgi:hypothetical protein